MTEKAALVALTKHPSWPDFEKIIDRKIGSIEEGVIARALHSRKPLDDEALEYIYYWRGFLHGLRYLVAVPTGAEARLESLLKESNSQREEAA